MSRSRRRGSSELNLPLDVCFFSFPFAPRDGVESATRRNSHYAQIALLSLPLALSASLSVCISVCPSVGPTVYVQLPDCPFTRPNICVFSPLCFIDGQSVWLFVNSLVDLLAVCIGRIFSVGISDRPCCCRLSDCLSLSVCWSVCVTVLVSIYLSVLQSFC